MILGTLGPLPEIQYTPYTKGDIVVHKREVYTIANIEEDTFVTLTSATGTVETITSAISLL